MADGRDNLRIRLRCVSNNLRIRLRCMIRHKGNYAWKHFSIPTHRVVIVFCVCAILDLHLACMLSRSEDVVCVRARVRVDCNVCVCLRAFVCVCFLCVMCVVCTHVRVLVRVCVCVCVLLVCCLVCVMCACTHVVSLYALCVLEVYSLHSSVYFVGVCIQTCANVRECVRARKCLVPVRTCTSESACV